MVSVCLLLKYSHFSSKTVLRAALCQNLRKHRVQWKVDFFYPWRTEAFLLWFCLCFQEGRKHLPAKFTLKDDWGKGLEYMRRLGWDLRSFSSNLPLGCTCIIWHNESMDDTTIKAPKTSGKKKHASFSLWILQIVEAAAKGRSKFPLIPDKIWAFWNATWFKGWIWILLQHLLPTQRCLQKASEAPEHPIRANPAHPEVMYFIVA